MAHMTLDTGLVPSFHESLDLRAAQIINQLAADRCTPGMAAQHPRYSPSLWSTMKALAHYALRYWKLSDKPWSCIRKFHYRAGSSLQGLEVPLKVQQKGSAKQMP